MPVSKPLTVPGKTTGAANRRRRPATVWAGVLLILASLGAVWYGTSDFFAPEEMQRPMVRPVHATPVIPGHPHPVTVPNPTIVDADERSGNLQAAFTALWQSERRVDKARAISIWNACVSAFPGSGGWAPSLQRAVAGLPAEPRYDAQRSAYADLFSRCKQFYGEDNAALMARTTQLRRAEISGVASTIARQAAATADRGDLPAARMLAQTALATREPFELFELAGMSSKLLAQDATPQQRAEAALQDASLAFAACELGFDCSANSLAAARLCAFEGLCSGTVQERLREKYAPEAEPSAVALAAASLIDALRNGGNPPRLYVIPTPVS